MLETGLEFAEISILALLLYAQRKLGVADDVHMTTDFYHSYSKLLHDHMGGEMDRVVLVYGVVVVVVVAVVFQTVVAFVGLVIVVVAAEQRTPNYYHYQNARGSETYWQTC